MATKYTFSFTDTSKTGFDLHAYTANGPVSPSNPTLIPNSVASTTTLKLYGKGMKDYGEGVEQNLIYMLENFANNIEPYYAIEGQTWYNNSTKELFIRNAVSAWDGVILATGTSAMTGELILSGDAVSSLGAVPLRQLTSHADDDSLHLTTDQDEFLDALIGASPILITADDVLQLEGITGNVQVQLDDKISRDGDTMNLGKDLTFDGGNLIMNSLGSPAANGNITMNGGTITGLTSTPTLLSEAVSKDYVDTLVFGPGVGDGALTAVDFIGAPAGSPPPIYDTTKTTLEFTVTQPGSPTTITYTVDGVARAGHFHTALDVIFDNTFNVSYPLNVQDAIEYVESNKANTSNPTFTGTVAINGSLTGTGDASFNGQVTAADPTLDTHLATKSYVDISAGVGGGVVVAANIVERKFELTAGGSPPAPYQVLLHDANDNKMSITINGMKYYNHLYGAQQIQYDVSHQGDILANTPTGLDQTRDYEFNITVDGGSAVTVTITAGTDISTYDILETTINALMAAGSPDLAAAIYTLEGSIINTEVFTSYTSGIGSSIVISDPGGSPDTYLFATDPSPTNILSAVFRSDLAGGSPGPTPDDIEITGDVTALFPVGKTFTIRNSADSIYGSFDGVYSVHDNGAVYSASPGTTLVPIALVSDSSIVTPLLPGYQPVGTGSPGPTAPSPSAYGSANFTPIGRFAQILTAVDGINGDYAETDSAGTTIPPGDPTDYVLFLITIPAGEKIETILLS